MTADEMIDFSNGWNNKHLKNEKMNRPGNIFEAFFEWPSLLKKGGEKKFFESQTKSLF